MFNVQRSGATRKDEPKINTTQELVYGNRGFLGAVSARMQTLVILGGICGMQ